MNSNRCAELSPWLKVFRVHLNLALAKRLKVEFTLIQIFVREACHKAVRLIGAIEGVKTVMCSDFGQGNSLKHHFVRPARKSGIGILA